jgi:hypothetical protein
VQTHPSQHKHHPFPIPCLPSAVNHHEQKIETPSWFLPVEMAPQKEKRCTMNCTIMWDSILNKFIDAEKYKYDCAVLNQQRCAYS